MRLRTISISLLCMVLLLVACSTSKHNYSHSIVSKRQIALIDKAIDGIAESNTLPRIDMYYGYITDVSDMQLFYRLLSIEDIDSLARNHPSPAVRTTMGIVLVERAPNAAKRLITERLADTSALITRSYGFCVVSKSGNTVGNVMLNYALGQNLFSREELKSIDSTIQANLACRHLNRYHQLTGTTIPRAAFLGLMNNRPHRSPSFRYDQLTNNRLVPDTTLFYRQISQITRYMQLRKYL